MNSGAQFKRIIRAVEFSRSEKMSREGRAVGEEDISPRSLRAK